MTSILRETTLGRMLEEVADRYPDNEALVFPERQERFTYREFMALVDGLAKGLMALGVEPGEKVAVWAPNEPFWVALQFATAHIGAVLVTVNTAYGREDIKYLLSHCEAENIFLAEGGRDLDYVQVMYELAPEISPSYESYMKLGMNLYKLGELEGSTAAYKKALIYDTENGLARNNLGWNLYLQDELEKAEKQFALAFEEERLSVALFNLGLTYLTQGRIELAEETYARAVAEFGAVEGKRLGVVAELRKLIERGIAPEAGRRILEIYWLD